MCSRRESHIVGPRVDNRSSMQETAAMTPLYKTVQFHVASTEHNAKRFCFYRVMRISVWHDIFVFWSDVLCIFIAFYTVFIFLYSGLVATVTVPL